MPPALKITNAAGQALPIGQLIGKGGEGSVYELNGPKPLAVKIYHQALNADKVAKLNALARIQTDKLLAISAWPMEIVRDGGGKPNGFLMPFVKGHKDIHALYTPKSRKDNFPQANWKFLIHTAANVARAFTVVHDAGCVIGDVNHGSVLAAQDGRVRLIDCDSFQVTANGKTYLCDVGTGPYTPPELQGRSFHGVRRTANHDLFGLAVMIFYLVFMGRHPFSGTFLGKGDKSLEQAIEEYRFVFGANNALMQMRPPPFSLSLNEIPNPLSSLIERAFSRNGSIPGQRPAASDWVTALEGLEQQLKGCSANPAHQYWNGLNACPWCKIEAGSGAFMFAVIVPASPGNSNFSITVVWGLIANITPPPMQPAMPLPTLSGISPTIDAVKAGKAALINKALAWAVGLSSLFATYITGGTLFFAIGIAWLIAAKLVKLDTGAAVYKAAFVIADKRWKDTQDRWAAECGNKKFDDKMTALRQVKTSWEGLRAIRQTRLNKLQSDQEKLQRERFLSSHTIERATIHGIGAGRKATLQSFNIENALDITERTIRNVPGFGDSFTKKLMDWRRSIERNFRFDPSRGIDPRDIAAIDADIGNTRKGYEQQLQSGASELLAIKNHIIFMRQNIAVEAEQNYKIFMQANANRLAAGC